jgi:hypothetical protein
MKSTSHFLQLSPSRRSNICKELESHIFKLAPGSEIQLLDYLIFTSRRIPNLKNYFRKKFMNGFYDVIDNLSSFHNHLPKFLKPYLLSCISEEVEFAFLEHHNFITTANKLFHASTLREKKIFFPPKATFSGKRKEKYISIKKSILSFLEKKTEKSSLPLSKKSIFIIFFLILDVWPHFPILLRN